MNDPHVVALFYNVKHSAAVDYSDAKPLEHEEDNFSVRIENKEVCFTMKAHYATAKEARKAVKEYIDNWEFAAGLRRESDMFKLVYWKPEIEYRNVESGNHVGAPDPVFWKFTTLLKDTIIIAPYPSPPQSGLKITPDVRSMSDRFAGYRLDREPLASMAYFCLTILEVLADPKNGARKNQKREPGTARKAAAEDYKIAVEVLSKIGELSSVKGARKAGGEVDFTIPEKRFLEKAVEAMIHRLAEVADGPVSRLPKIELTDLPQC